MTNQENIFRFISLRAAQIENGTGRLKMNLYGSSDNFPMYSELKGNSKIGITKEYVLTVTETYKKSGSYIDDLDAVKFPISAMLRWLSKHGHQTFEEACFVSAFEKILNIPIGEVNNDKEFNDFFHNICDSVFSDILSNNAINDKEEKIRIIKILFTLKSISNKTLKIINDEIIDSFFVKSSVIFPSIKIRAEERNSEEETKGNSDSPEHGNKEILRNLEIAHRELSNLAMDEQFRVKPEINTLNSEDNLNQTPAMIEADGFEELTKNKISQSSAFQELILSKESFEILSEESKKVISNLNLEPSRINPIKAVFKIEDEIKHIQSKTPSDFQNTKLIAFGNTLVDKEKLKAAIIGKSNSIEDRKNDFVNKCKYEAGIADLLVVKQKLKAYELAEFAHVENALAGEFKERVHKRLDSTEITKTSSTETEIEKEKDLQSTERSEMQTESEKILKQQSHLEAGVQMTASYGPSLSITASLNTGFSSSVQDSQRRATSFSREISEKTAEKIRTKVSEQQTRKTLSEIRETNIHKIDNTKGNPKNIRGIYRWLNKIYDAQVFNYGQRMMYEFVIPEPAAFYLYATLTNPPPDSELSKPEPPSYYDMPLSPAHLTRTNYFDYVSKYNVINAPQPPSQFKVKSFNLKIDNTKLQEAETIIVEVPEGYEAFNAMISCDYAYTDPKALIHIAVGGYNFTNIASDPWGSWLKQLNSYPKYRGEISFSYSYYNCLRVFIGTDIFCSLTVEETEKWQLKVYDSIMQAYLDQKAAYEAKLEERSIQSGVQISGNNPLENRRIEKEELKKLIIMILSNSPQMNFDSFSSSAEPVIDISKTCSNGSYIRFLENAFEWENILYVFYSYFWGRHANWIEKMHITDTDSDFAAFLKAGAARVQIPVRENFEKAIAYFCQTGTIWEGNDVPVIGDKLYLPIISEITENLGKPGNEKPYPPNSSPWEVVVPTSLVLLQDLSEIPNIRDMLSGNTVKLKPKKSLWQSFLSLFSS
ncbi:MAG: hypothetical protein WA584_02240 [Pyrinomonadaceae bacterium]